LPVELPDDLFEEGIALRRFGRSRQSEAHKGGDCRHHPAKRRVVPSGGRPAGGSPARSG